MRLAAITASILLITTGSVAAHDIVSSRPLLETMPAQPLAAYDHPFGDSITNPEFYGSEGNIHGDVNINPFNSDSIANPYSRYGSPFSPYSSGNPFGQFGSPYGIVGPGTSLGPGTSVLGATP